MLNDVAALSKEVEIFVGIDDIHHIRYCETPEIEGSSATMASLWYQDLQRLDPGLYRLES